MWEKGLSSHHEVSGNKELGTSAFIFLAPIIISVDGQHPVAFFPFVFAVIQEYLQKKKKKHFWRVTPSLNKGPAVPALVSLAPGCRYRGVVSERLQVLLGMASPPCALEAALSMLYLSTPSG